MGDWACPAVTAADLADVVLRPDTMLGDRLVLPCRSMR